MITIRVKMANSRCEIGKIFFGQTAFLKHMKLQPFVNFDLIVVPGKDDVVSWGVGLGASAAVDQSIKDHRTELRSLPCKSPISPKGMSL
jgi:hypothetical protein